MTDLTALTERIRAAMPRPVFAEPVYRGDLPELIARALIAVGAVGASVQTAPPAASKMLPRQATPEMMYAAIRCGSHASSAEIYHAMLEAAPNVPPPPVPDVEAAVLAERERIAAWHERISEQSKQEEDMAWADFHRSAAIRIRLGAHLRASDAGKAAP